MDETDNAPPSCFITKKKGDNVELKYHTNLCDVWSTCALRWLCPAPETKMTFANKNTTCWKGGIVAVWCWIRNTWSCSFKEGGSWTHLSAHCAVDGDDDKALDRVKNGKKDLVEGRSICLLITAHCFLTQVNHSQSSTLPTTHIRTPAIISSLFWIKKDD